MRHSLLSLLSITAIAVATSSAALAEPASWFGGEFSADLVMYNPQNPANKAQGKFYVGSQMVRAEGSHQGTNKVVIIDYAHRQSWTLLPEKRQYHAGIGEAPMPPSPEIDPLPGDADSPCKQVQGTTPACKMLGMESLNGVSTEKWEINLPQQQDQQPMTMQVWADPQRRLILRQQMNNGPTMERHLVGMEAVNNRPTEKWEIVHSFKEQSHRIIRWVDAKLRVPVRMVMDNQLVAEINNIQEGPQAAQLFEVPKEFQKIEAPRPEQQPAGGNPQGQSPVGGR